MKILLTADLHFRPKWFDWLIGESAKFDLMCIAGDLLDIFAKEPRADQAREVSRLLRRLAQRTRLALCSGNYKCRAPDFK
jgi:Icc-related predicted phosphoesterase